MNDKKQTAVEWLTKILDNQKNEPLNFDEWKIAFEYAKEIEKDQIIDFAYIIADDLACGKYGDKKAMEERYNEYLTFKQQKDTDVPL